MDTISKLYQRAYIIVGILAVMAFVIMFGLGYLTAKHRYNQPIETKIERDTIVQYDTVPHYYPKPVEVTKTKTEYRWLTRVEHFRDTTKMIDSVLVEVPITSKHYSSSEYDAWVSGYEPSLDSIKVYQKTEYINTTITKVVKDNKYFFVDVAGGCEYLFNNKSATPFAELGLTFKPSKWGIGVTGGYHHNGANNTGEPYARIKLSYDIINF